MPTPSRKTWIIEQTDRWLRDARSAHDAAVRQQAVTSLPHQPTEASAWFPVARIRRSGARAARARPQGLDIQLTR